MGTVHNEHVMRLIVVVFALFSWYMIHLTKGLMSLSLYCSNIRDRKLTAPVSSMVRFDDQNLPSCSLGGKQCSKPFSRNSKMNMAGFGKKSDSMSKKVIVDGNAPCPCGSNSIYSKCCGPFHSLDAFATDPFSMTLARFSAFSISDADYIIDTTFYKHKDYKRYLESSALDVKKSKAKWKKEIITLNCDQFEFLKCEILPEPVINDKVKEVMEKYPHSSEDMLITFNVLVRQKSSQEFISFQETSIYTDKENDSDKNQAFKRSNQNIFYCEAVVKALDKEDNERLVRGVGYQRSSIKDQW